MSGAAWGRRGKPCLGQIQPLVPVCPCPCPCLLLCTHRNTPSDRLLYKPQVCRPLCSSSLCAAAGCGGKTAGILILSFLHWLSLAWGCSAQATVLLAVPALFKLQEILQTKHLPALSYVRHHTHWEGECEEERVCAKWAECSPSLRGDAYLRSGAVGAETEAPSLLHLVSPFLSCEMRMPGPCWGRVGVDEIIEQAEALPGQAWPYPGPGSPGRAGRLRLSRFAQR